jgi:tRNA (guanine-N7-)-methyltransferase
MPRVRVHQHVNPLAPRFQELTPPIDFEKAFIDPQLPLHLDIGCARGRFLLKMAPLEPEWNFLGLEIREPLVGEANRIKNEKLLTNLHYEYCNATISLGNVLQNLAPGILQMVTIQFPDPWFKKKHFKRRMVKTELINDIAANLATGGKVFMQSDVKDVAEEIVGFFAASPDFKRCAGDIRENPFPVKTEREGAVEEKGLPVYRAMWERRIHSA